MMEAGAAAIYCAASFQLVERTAPENIPVTGQVSLIAHFCIWTGGLTAVAKTVASATAVYERWRYAILAKEFARIQQMRVDAFILWVDEVCSGAWLYEPCIVKSSEADIDAFNVTTRKGV